MKAEILGEWRKARGLTTQQTADALSCGTTTVKVRAKDGVVINGRIYVPLQTKKRGEK